MKTGDIVHMTSCTVVASGMRATFGIPPGLPKGSTMAFVFLGNARADEAFDPVAALQAIGWKPGAVARKAQKAKA